MESVIPSAGLRIPRPTTPPAEPDALRRGAERVLRRNWTGTSTVPSRGLYPHQWSWDSAFIAIGLRHFSPRRAQRELETLLDAQWGDGRVPHIVFNPEVAPGAYFPSPDFWRSSRAGADAGAPAHTETSGIVQPPVHALAAWLVHEADPETSEQHGFLERMYPRLAAWHRYLADSRNLGGHGLVSAVHPWEPGMDNSPCWDRPLQRVEPAEAGSYQRADLDHGKAGDRPTDLDYGRYVRLAADYRDRGYRDDDAPHPFAVEDPGVNALLILSEHALARIAAAVGTDPAEHRARAERLTRSMVEHLWDPAAGIFRCYDVRGGEQIRELSVAGLIPLAVPGLPEDIVEALLRTASGPHFGLGRSVRLAPSYDLRGPSFDPCRYWRGPAWFNINWLLERGLRQYGAVGTADDLRSSALSAADTSGFAEYVDPYTGQARGTRGFSWTAALALDLLTASERAAAGSPADEVAPGPETAADPLETTETAEAEAAVVTEAEAAVSDAEAGAESGTEAAEAEAGPETAGDAESAVARAPAIPAQQPRARATPRPLR